MNLPRPHYRFSHRAAALCLGVFLGLSIGVAFGSSPQGASALAFPAVGGCPISKRFDNWGTFVSDGLSARDFYVNFADIFTKNSCQQGDIFNLQKAIDASQHELRQRIFTCKNSGVDALAKSINDLKFELEYVRAAVDTDEERPSADGVKGVVPNREKLAQILSASTVVKRGLISAKRFQELFPILEQKYASKIQSYRSCVDPSWQALTDSWNTFIKTWGGVSPAWNKAKVATEARFNKATEIPSGKSGQFFGGLLDVKLNSLKPQQTFNGIYQAFLKNTPGLGGGSGKSSGWSSGGSGGGSSGGSGRAPTQSDYLNALDSDAARYAAQEEYVRRQAHYEFLYRISRDNAAAAMKKEAEDMNATLESSLPIIDKVRGGVACIAQRQCGGK